MYSGPADITFFHQERPQPPNQLDVYFNVGINITLNECPPWFAQLQTAAVLAGVEGATRVRVRLPNGQEYEGAIKPSPTDRGFTSIMFTLQRIEDTSGSRPSNDA